MATLLKPNYVQMPRQVWWMSIRWPQEANTYVKWPKPVKLQKAPMWKRIIKGK